MKKELERVLKIDFCCTEEQIKDIRMLLKIYKKILHTVTNKLIYLDEYTYTTSRKHLSELVDSLIDCDTMIDKKVFEDRLSECRMSLYLLSVIDKALILVRDYPDIGIVYYDILERYYCNNFKYTHDEIIEILDIPPSSYYRYFKAAIKCFCFYFIRVMKMSDDELNRELFVS